MDLIKKYFKNEKSYIGAVAILAAIILLVSTIIGFTKEPKEVASLIILISASVAIIGGALVNNLYNPKIGVLAVFMGNIAGLIGYRMSVNVASEGLLCTWLICLLAGLVASINLYAKMEKAAEKSWVKRLNILPFILSIVTLVFIVYLLISLVPSNGTVSIVVCCVLIAIILASKVLTIINQIPNGSLLMILVPFFTIVGMKPTEIGKNDVSVVLLVVLYILTIILAIAECALGDKYKQRKPVENASIHSKTPEEAAEALRAFAESLPNFIEENDEEDDEIELVPSFRKEEAESENEESVEEVEQEESAIEEVVKEEQDTIIAVHHLIDEESDEHIEVIEKVSKEEVDELMSDNFAYDHMKTSSRVADKTNCAIINIDTISEYFEAGEKVTLEEIKKRVPYFKNNVTYVKVLARGYLDKPLIVDADDFSIEAVKMILLTGGKVICDKVK